MVPKAGASARGRLVRFAGVLECAAIVANRDQATAVRSKRRVSHVGRVTLEYGQQPRRNWIPDSGRMVTADGDHIVPIGTEQRVPCMGSMPLERPEQRAAGARSAYFGSESGWIETPVLAREQLAATREGPFIVEEYDATCLVPPGGRAELDGYGNIVIEL